MIGPFEGEYAFLSNFELCRIEYEGIVYSSSEAAFQAQKCKSVLDKFDFTNLTPGQAKRKGKKVKLREDWEEVKDEIMYNICKAKFLQNSILRDKLLATGNQEIVEINTWNDTYWGVCRGKGQNKLGKILMRVREELRGGI